MSYKSQAQRGKFHILERQGKISPAVVEEFDKASKGMKLPKRVHPDNKSLFPKPPPGSFGKGEPRRPYGRRSG